MFLLTSRSHWLTLQATMIFLPLQTIARMPMEGHAQSKDLFWTLLIQKWLLIGWPRSLLRVQTSSATTVNTLGQPKFRRDLRKFLRSKCSLTTVRTTSLKLKFLCLTHNVEASELTKQEIGKFSNARAEPSDLRLHCKEINRDLLWDSATLKLTSAPLIVILESMFRQ